MKTIGLIAAMESEIVHVKSIMEINVAKSAAGMEFYIGKISGKSAVAVRCGIGKVNAAVCTQLLIDHFAVDLVINMGTAGAIYTGLNVGDIIVSEEACQHDFDATAFGYMPGIIPQMSESFFSADAGLVKIAMDSAAEIEGAPTVIKGRVASGDQFISSAAAKAKIWTDTKAYCAEMEGAAIAQTCFLNNVPFVIIRVVSDKADESATISFDDFVKTYIRSYGELIAKMIEKI